MDNVKFIAAGFTIELNRKVKVDDHPLWGSQCLLLHPKEEVETHKEFLKGGVDVLITNTYQASIPGFMKYLGLNKEESYDLIKKSVTLCQEAIQLEKYSRTIDPEKEILIAGSVGSFGAYLSDGSEYTGTFLETHSIEEISDWHQARIHALVEAGVDYLAFETIPCMKEAEILLNILKQYPEQKAWLSFSAKDEYHNGYGEKFNEVVTRAWSLNPTQLVAVGVNCIGARIAMKLIESVENKNEIPIIVYPNCGKVWDAKKKEWLNSNNEEDFYDNLIYEWCEMGVKFIGLCCGTTMESRLRAKNVIDKFREESRSKLLQQK